MVKTCSSALRCRISWAVAILESGSRNVAIDLVVGIWKDAAYHTDSLRLGPAQYPYFLPSRGRCDENRYRPHVPVSGKALEYTSLLSCA